MIHPSTMVLLSLLIVLGQHSYEGFKSRKYKFVYIKLLQRGSLISKIYKKVPLISKTKYLSIKNYFRAT